MKYFKLSWRKLYSLLLSVSSLRKMTVLACLIVAYFVVTLTFSKTRRIANVLSDVTSTYDHTNTLDWIIVNGNVLIYSAFYDRLYEPDVIRVIGAVTSLHLEVDCLVQHEDSPNNLRRSPGFITNINEEHGMEFTAAYILCYVTNETTPTYIYIMPRDGRTPRSRPVPVLPILHRYSINYVVCVPPLHSTIDIYRLVVWIEMNQLLGVEKFVFYNYDVPLKIMAVLKYYESSNILELHNWSLNNPYASHVINTSIHYYGQLVAINDCVYRAKSYSRFVASFDIDEFIIPQGKNDLTWNDIVDLRLEYDVFMFRNVFFLPPTDRLADSGGDLAYILRWIEHCDEIHPVNDRTKMIVRSGPVVALGIHSVWALRGQKIRIIEPEIALLHHYRTNAIHHCADTRTNNLVADKYGLSLNKNVKKTMAHLHKLLQPNIVIT